MFPSVITILIQWPINNCPVRLLPNGAVLFIDKLWIIIYKYNEFKMTPINFLKTAIKDLKVGAVMPSSKYAVRKILQEIKTGHKCILEYGAGDGVITREILKILPKNGRLIAIELNKEFVSHLNKIQDRRLTVIHNDVLNVISDWKKSGDKIDLIISGIPFSFFKKSQREAIVRDTHKLLTKKSHFLVYQSSPLILPLLKKYFAKVKILFEPRNLPPYFIMVAEK